MIKNKEEIRLNLIGDLVSQLESKTSQIQNITKNIQNILDRIEATKVKIASVETQANTDKMIQTSLMTALTDVQTDIAKLLNVI